MRKVGLVIPLSALDASPRTTIELARIADEAGVHSLWLMDRVMFDNFDPLVALAAAAQVTERARIGTCVLLANLRHPILLAKMLATLDQLSQGRLIVGIGVGTRRTDYDALGIPLDRRGRRARETVEVLREAWGGEAMRYRGQVLEIDSGAVGPRPVQPGGPPIWLGGESEAAVRRAGTMADGYICGWFGGPHGFRENSSKLTAFAEAAGRDPAGITQACLSYSCVDDDPKRAWEMANTYFSYLYERPFAVPPWVMLGPPDACATVAEGYFQAGVQLLIVGSVSAEPERFARLCREVVPMLSR